MGIIQSLKGMFTKGVGQTVLLDRFLNVNYGDTGFYALVKRGYQFNELVYAGIRAIAESFAESPLRAYDPDGNEIANYPVVQLLNRPNPYLTTYRLWESYLTNLYLSGNSYVEKVRSRSGKVLELWTVRSDIVKPKSAPNEFVSGYEIQVDGKIHYLPRQDIIHDLFVDPVNPYVGQSPLEAAWRRIQTDNEMIDFTGATLKNKGIAPGVVIGIEGAQPSQDDIERMRSQWSERYGGKNRGKPAFIGNATKIQNISMTMQDIALPSLNEIDEARILMCLKVPPIIIGAMVGLNRSTFSNYEEAREAFHEDTIEPLQERVAQAIHHGFYGEQGYRDDVVLRFDNSRVSALDGNRDRSYEQVRKNVAAGLVTRNEARARIGELPVADGDVFLTPMNIVATPAIEQVVRTGKRKMLPAPEKKDRDLAQLEEVIGRMDAAEAWKGHVFDAMSAVFKTERKDIREILDTVRDQFKTRVKQDEITEEQLRAIAEKIAALTITWTTLTNDTVKPVIAEILTEASELTAANIGIDFEIDNAFRQAFIRDYTYKFAGKVTDTGIAQIRQILLDVGEGEVAYGDLRKVILDELQGWGEIGIGKVSRAEAIAQSETIRAANGGAKLAYKEAGFTGLEWVAAGDACAFCLYLDGRIIGIDETFFDEGDVLELPNPKNPDKPLRLAFNYGEVPYPPGHNQCRCAAVGVDL